MILDVGYIDDDEKKKKQVWDLSLMLIRNISTFS
jgi:hypothetical protein